MSKLNLTRKTFLEKEELNRFQDFLEYNSTRHVTLSNTTNWGIVRSNFVGEDLNFKVEIGTNIGSIKVDKAISYALDKDGLLLNLPQTLNYAIPNDNQWYWLRISHQYRRYEEGYVSVDSLGNISGLNTLFTQTLRGQATEVPTKIRFIRDDGGTLINTGTYEVIDIGSDIIASATSTTGFVAESNLRMIVIGATPISEAVTAEQLEGLYKYDGCLLEYVLEVSGEPTLIADKQFHIARVKNNAGSITIEDKRTQYWSSNVPGVSDRLSKFENLNDLGDKAEARTNLDVYSTEEADALFGGTTDVSDFARKSNNLSDLTDKTTARSNLGVYDKGTMDAALGNRLVKDSNLSDLTNKSVARTNLDVYDRAYIDKYRPFAVGFLSILEIPSPTPTVSVGGNFTFVSSSVPSYGGANIVRLRLPTPTSINVFSLNTNVKCVDIATQPSGLSITWSPYSSGGVQYVDILIRELDPIVQNSPHIIYLEAINTYGY